MSEYRIKRTENLVRDEISRMIMRGVIKDPRVTTAASVSRVTVSRDIAHAKVYISSFESEKSLERCVSALNHAAGFVQRELGRVMKTRHTPKVVFFADTGIKDGLELMRKLEDSDS